MIIYIKTIQELVIECTCREFSREFSFVETCSCFLYQLIFPKIWHILWKTIHAVFRTEWLGRNPQATDFIVLIQYYVSFWNASTGNQSQFLVHTTVTLGPTCSLVLAYILFRSWIFTSGLQFKMFFIWYNKQSAWCTLATIFLVAKCLARMYISLQPVCFLLRAECHHCFACALEPLVWNLFWNPKDKSLLNCDQLENLFIVL